MKDARQLIDLVSIGPAALRDLHRVGIYEVSDLKNKVAQELYDKLCKATGQKHDICCLDVFSAAIAQAQNPKLPKKQCQWFYWSEKRKAAKE